MDCESTSDCSAGLARVHARARQRGQGLTEYAIVLSVIAVAAIAAMAFLGGTIRSRIGGLASAIAGDSKDSVEQANNRAIDSAKNANKSAGKVTGMKLEHGGEAVEEGTEVIDSISLSSGGGN